MFRWSGAYNLQIPANFQSFGCHFHRYTRKTSVKNGRCGATLQVEARRERGRRFAGLRCFCCYIIFSSIRR